MSIVRAIGFDEGSADSGTFYTGTGFDSANILTSPNPRTGSYCLSLGGTGTQSWRTNFPGSYQTGWVYFAFRVATLPSVGDTNGTSVFYLMDEGTAHMYLRVSSTGRLNLYKGDGTFLATSSSTAVAVGAWCHVAWKYSIHDSTGISQIRFNGRSTNDIDFSGDTRNGANAVVNQLQFSIVELGGLSSQIDDIVIQDTTGSSPENNWLVDPECRYVFPNSTDASSIGFNPAGTSPVGTRHQSVDDIPTDEGVTTIESETLNDQAVFGTAGVPLVSGTIYAVIPSPRANKTAGGYRSITTAIVSGSNVVSGDTIVLTNTFQTHQSGQVFHRSSDGTAWDAVKFNNHLFKIVVTG